MLTLHGEVEVFFKGCSVLYLHVKGNVEENAMAEVFRHTRTHKLPFSFYKLLDHYSLLSVT